MQFNPNVFVLNFSIYLNYSLCRLNAGVRLRMNNSKESMLCSKQCSSNECMDKADF